MYYISFYSGNCWLIYEEATFVYEVVYNCFFGDIFDIFISMLLLVLFSTMYFAEQ